jgi:glycosyltransferase involved in cell wall biosynthesis
MKLLSIVIPCYNSQAYMKKCIESLLPGGELVELLIVNDGSSDNTGAIADEYAMNYPAIVKAIHQLNGGHGEAVNAGIRNATGIYFKVIDSDDWVEGEAYARILATLQTLIQNNTQVDMLVSNYVYEKEGAIHKRVIHYDNVLPEECVFTWKEIGHFRKGQYILMHSVIYRLQLLKDCGLQLPKHTFYVDNLYVFVPLPYVNSIYYLNVDFYRYYIGREDQSVNEKVMISRIDQQIRVNKLMMELVNIHSVSNSNRRRYMMNYLEIITVVSTILMIRSGTEENLRKKQELWQYIKENDIKLYYRLRHGIMGFTVNLPGKTGHKISLAAYKLSQKVVGFN